MTKLSISPWGEGSSNPCVSVSRISGKMTELTRLSTCVARFRHGANGGVSRETTSVEFRIRPIVNLPRAAETARDPIRRERKGTRQGCLLRAWRPHLDFTTCQTKFNPRYSQEYLAKVCFRAWSAIASVTERVRIAQAARPSGGIRQQAEAAQREAALIRRDRERAR